MAKPFSGGGLIDGTAGPDSLAGGAGHDTIHGGAADDTVLGGSGRDALSGDGGEDSLSGGNAADTLTGGAGGDLVDGGNGRDLAVFSDVAGNYQLTRLADGSIQVKGIAGAALADGTDRLLGVEAIRFSDATIQASSVVQPCFAAGTLIRTARGEVPVEALREGDMIALAGGGLAPALWIGRRSVDVLRHRWPDLVRPVLVRAGALAEGVPARDLRLSPEHALALDGGVLVPAGLLVNDRSIVQEHGVERVTYFHVELPAHAVLFAEGAPAESYLDIGNRFMFEDGAGEAVVALHPDFGAAGREARDAAAWCAPRVEGGAALEAIRARLIARAEALGLGAPTEEADLHLLVDGRPLRGAAVPGGLVRFELPAGARAVAVASRAACLAAEGSAWGGDRRALGVALAAIRLRDPAAGTALEVPITDASLGLGFHGAEEFEGTPYRWTDGHAVLPGRWLAGFGGAPLVLELQVYARLPRYRTARAA